MFKKLTRSVVGQTDPRGDLVPVHSIFDHEHFRPLCLVRRKRKATFHSSPCYKRTGYRLDDVLLPEDDSKSTDSLFPSGGGEAAQQFTVQKSVSDKVDGNLSLSVDSMNLELKGAASLSKGWSIKLEKKYIAVPKLEGLTKERKMNVNHSFLQQLEKAQQNLYVVHETIETSEETDYEESTKSEGSFMTQLYTKLRAQGTREHKQSITIPKGCTLAFRVIQLATTDSSWGLVYFPKEKRSMFDSDSSSRGKLGSLEDEVRENCQILSRLSSDLSIKFLKAIKAVLRDRNLFQELTQKIDAILDQTGNCELKTESLDLKDLMSILQDSQRHLLLQLARAIAYTLDALDELTEDQLLLLLESLEDKIVSQQFKLVENILEQDIEHEKGPFSVDTSLLSFPQEIQQKLTIAIVEMGGVKLQKDGSAVCTEGAFSAMAALYASLYVLNLLNNSD